MRFSLIVPTYNSSRFLSSCLDGISHLCYAKSQYEVIVVDGGSNDGTEMILDSYPGVTRVRSSNLSISNNRNLGARHARGDILVFIDSDCIVDETLLVRAEEHLRVADCCGGFYKPLPFHGWVSKTWLCMERKSGGQVKWLPGGTLVVKKEVFFEVGGFSEDMATSEDVDFGRKLTDRGYLIHHDPEIGSFHLGQSDSLTGFFQKEMWRGKSSSLLSLLKGRAGSLRFAVGIIGYSIGLCSLFLSIVSRHWLLASLALLFLLIVPIGMACRNIPGIRKWEEKAKASVLMFVFLIARSLALLWLVTQSFTNVNANRYHKKDR